MHGSREMKNGSQRALTRAAFWRVGRVNECRPASSDWGRRRRDAPRLPPSRRVRAICTSAPCRSRCAAGRPSARRSAARRNTAAAPRNSPPARQGRALSPAREHQRRHHLVFGQFRAHRIDRDPGHRGMAQQHLLDLERRDVLAAAADRILDPVDEAEGAVAPRTTRSPVWNHRLRQALTVSSGMPK